MSGLTLLVSPEPNEAKFNLGFSNLALKLGNAPSQYFFLRHTRLKAFGKILVGNADLTQFGLEPVVRVSEGAHKIAQVGKRLAPEVLVSEQVSAPAIGNIVRGGEPERFEFSRDERRKSVARGIGKAHIHSRSPNGSILGGATRWSSVLSAGLPSPRIAYHGGGALS